MQTGTQPATTCDVRGLPNPFLGLHSYTFNERKRFAGRDKALLEVMHRLTGMQQTILFINGPSGVGKSSFAQAKLLPELEAYYTNQNLTPLKIILRPGNYPLSALSEALARINPARALPDLTIQGGLNQFLNQATPAEQINLILIDRFEELFTLSHQGQRKLFMEAIGQAAPLSQSRTHIIVTFNSSFLSEINWNAQLARLVQNGYNLPDMTFEELRQTIVQPVEHVYSGAGKRFDPELVEQLALDALQRPNPLPWLQITLRQLWDNGWLILEKYQPATVIQHYAEAVVRYKDYTGGKLEGYRPRPVKEQAEILDIFSNLVCPDWWQAAARPYPRPELERGSAERKKLIEELNQAQLLKINVESGQEIIELVHERLVSGWEKLNELAGLKHREALMARRFQEDLQRWVANNRLQSYLLTGTAVKEATELKRKRNPVLFTGPAQEFYRRSYRRTYGRRWAIGLALLIFMLTSVVLPAQLAAQKAGPVNVVAARVSTDTGNFVYSQNGAAYKDIVFGPDRTTLAAITEGKGQIGLEIRNAGTRELKNSAVYQGNHISNLSFAPNGQQIAFATGGSVFVLNAATLEPLYRVDNQAQVDKVEFSPNGQYLVLASGYPTRYQINLVDTRSRKLVVQDLTKSIISGDFAISKDGLLAVTEGAVVSLWSLTTLNFVETVRLDQYSPIVKLAFSPSNNLLAVATEDYAVHLWDLKAKVHRKTIRVHAGAVRVLTFSPTGSYMASYADDASVKYWSLDGTVIYTAQGVQAVSALRFYGSSNYLTLATSNLILDKPLYYNR